MKLKIDDYDYKYIAFGLASKPLDGECMINMDMMIDLEFYMKNGKVNSIMATRDGYVLFHGDDIECDYEMLNNLIHYYREND